MKRLLALLVLVSACSFGARPVEAASLSLGFKAGDHYSARIHLVMDLTTEFGGTARPIRGDITINQDTKVVSVDADGTATLQVSAGPPSGTINGVTLPAGAPSSVTLRVSPDGRVTGAAGIGVFGAGPATGTVSAGDPFLPPLPGHKVKPGDAWQSAYDVPITAGSGKIHLAATSRYLRNEGALAVIQTTSTTTLDFVLDLKKLLEATGQPTRNLPPGSNPTITYKGTVGAEQTSWLDTKLRRVSKATVKQRVDLVVTLGGGPGQVPTDAAGPIHVAGTQTVDLNIT
ncbi:MAG TPA: hypothetical protein VK131_10140 [Candidatus Acidoferrales bacterium]|nr:hypothetical protein [Candidatus Acidoferrales bacterium]